MMLLHTHKNLIQNQNQPNQFDWMLIMKVYNIHLSYVMHAHDYEWFLTPNACTVIIARAVKK